MDIWPEVDTQEFFKFAIRKIVELKARQGELFNSAGYNKYIKDKTPEEIKKNIIVYIIAGKDFFKDANVNLERGNKKIFSLDSDMFNKIDIFYSSYCADEDVNVGLTYVNGRDLIQLSSLEIYRPYIDIDKIESYKLDKIFVKPTGIIQIDTEEK